MPTKWILAATLAVALLVAGCGEDDEGEGGSNQSVSESLLFVQGAEAGTLDTREGTLTLTQASPSVTYFSDRPQRTAGQTSLASFGQDWEEIFGGDPPNAAIQHLGGPRRASPAVVELLQPPEHEGGRTVSYRVRLIDPPPGLPKQLRFDELSLFIDSGGAVTSGGAGSSCTITDPRCDTAAQSAPGCNWGDTHNCPQAVQSAPGCDPYVDPRCDARGAASSSARRPSG